MSTTATPVVPNVQASSAGSEASVQQRLRVLADDAQALLAATARAGDEKFDASRERLRDELRHLRERLGELEHAGAERIKRGAHQADEAVHSHPYTAMGVAAVAGVMLGFLLGRR